MYLYRYACPCLHINAIVYKFYIIRYVGLIQVRRCFNLMCRKLKEGYNLLHTCEKLKEGYNLLHTCEKLKQGYNLLHTCEKLKTILVSLSFYCVLQMENLNTITELMIADMNTPNIIFLDTHIYD